MSFEERYLENVINNYNNMKDTYTQTGDRISEMIVKQAQANVHKAIAIVVQKDFGFSIAFPNWENRKW